MFHYEDETRISDMKEYMTECASKVNNMIAILYQSESVTISGKYMFVFKWSKLFIGFDRYVNTYHVICRYENISTHTHTYITD